jgi:hypothetical protein
MPDSDAGKVKESSTPEVPTRPKAPEWDDYWAHQVAEKAKKIVLAYFGLATPHRSFGGSM